MIKFVGSLFIGICVLALTTTTHRAFATPSTHVWSPSTDIQPSGTFHVTSDMYVPSENDASGKKPDTVTDLGLEGGLWPIKDKLGFEYGFDVVNGFGALDNYPLYFNAKIGTTEDAFFEYAPAFAVGIYNVGTKAGKTDIDSYFLEAARTFKVHDFSLGRVSAGWFWGNSNLLLGPDGKSDDNGPILAWERVLSEISDKLWVCVDYQGSQSSLGALAPGFSWKFADNVSMIFGYVIPNNSDLAETFTVQLDIDF